MKRYGLNSIVLPTGSHEHEGAPGRRAWWKTLHQGNPTAERIGTSLFVSLLFSAAISEALNNVLIILLLIWWLWTRPAVRELRTAPKYLLIIVLFCTTPLVSLVTSTVGDPSDRIGDVTGVVKLALLLLPVYSLSSRNRLSVDLVTTCLAVGAVIASAEAFVTWHFSSGDSPVLRALAGINESAMYMSVILAAAVVISWSPNLCISILGYAGIMTSLWLSLISDSITALVVSTCVLFLAAVTSIFIKRQKRFLSVIACLAALSGMALASTDAHFYWKRAANEFTNQVYGNEVGAHRIEIFNTATEVYGRNFWFGAGYRQFGKATSVEVIAQKIEKEGRIYGEERNSFYHAPHGHNIWTQVLVERGFVGIGLFLSFLLVTAFGICRNVFDLYRRGERDLELVQLAFISCAAWTVLVVGGMGDLIIRNEHGMVALLLLVWSITGFGVRFARIQNSASTRER